MGLFSKSEPEGFDVQGKPLRCVVCGHQTFHKREAQLHGPVASFFDLEWTGATANCIVCAECGYVHWFL